MRNTKAIFFSLLSAVSFNLYANTIDVPFINAEVTPGEQGSLLANYKLSEKEVIICNTRVGSADATIEWQYANQNFTHLLPVFLKSANGKLLVDRSGVLRIKSEGKAVVSCQYLDLL